MTIKIDWTLPWLGYFPIAVDLVNTVISTARGSVDLLSDEAGLEEWIGRQHHRLPVADAARGRGSELRELRFRLRDLLYAAALRRPLPRDALKAVNQASSDAPYFPILQEAGTTRPQELSDDPFVILRASLARSAIGLISSAERSRLAICHAPSCGMLFMRDRPRQTWCTTTCGNRARVARHAARTRGRDRRPAHRSR